MTLKEANDLAKRKHNMMDGSAITGGPDERLRYIASGKCKLCNAWILGKWTRSKEKSLDPVMQAALHRAQAVTVLLKEFNRHLCEGQA